MQNIQLTELRFSCSELVPKLSVPSVPAYLILSWKKLLLSASTRTVCVIGPELADAYTLLMSPKSCMGYLWWLSLGSGWKQKP